MGIMKNYRQLLKELPSNKVVFAFGQFQPPTAIHELHIKAVKKLAEETKADYQIYTPSTQDLKENFLSLDKKVQYMNLMFPATHIRTAENLEEAAKELNKKYKNLVMVTSADCKEEYEHILNKGNGSKFYFESIQVLTTGDKNPDVNKSLRESAKKGDYAKFKVSLPSGVREIDGRRLMNDVRVGMGLETVKEQINLVKDDIREQYFRGEIFKLEDHVVSEGITYQIIKRGSNHLLLQAEDGSKVSKWIQDVQPLTEEAMQEDVVNKSSTFNIAKDRLRLKDFKKLSAMNAGKMGMTIAREQAHEQEAIEDQEETGKKEPNREAGHTLGSRDDNHRRRKVGYHLGEANDMCKVCGQTPCNCTSIEEAKKKKEKKTEDKTVKQNFSMTNDGQQVGDNNSHGFDAFFNEETEEEMNDEEIEKMISGVTDDDIINHAYEDDELCLVDDETGEEINDKEKEVNEAALMEVLSRMERMKAKARFAKTKAIRERKVMIALKRTSSTETINKRARRLAIQLMKKRLLRGRDPSKLSVGEKERIERQVAKRKPILNRIAMKLAPRVRQIEKARLAHHKFTQGSNK